MRRLACVLAAGLAFAGQTTAHAADIPGSCMVSFNVKDKQFMSGATTMSCRAVEQRRLELFTKINASQPSGNLDGADLAKRLAELEATLRQQETAQDWKGMSKSLSGNFIATLGLTACFATAPGCALAVIGKVMSVVDIIDGAASQNDKMKQAAAMRQQIASIRKTIESKVTPADKVRNALVGDAVDLCTDVRKYCLDN